MSRATVRIVSDGGKSIQDFLGGNVLDRKACQTMADEIVRVLAGNVTYAIATQTNIVTGKKWAPRRPIFEDSGLPLLFGIDDGITFTVKDLSPDIIIQVNILDKYLVQNYGSKSRRHPGVQQPKHSKFTFADGYKYDGPFGPGNQIKPHSNPLAARRFLGFTRRQKNMLGKILFGR